MIAFSWHRSPKSWRIRAIVVATIAIAYSSLFYYFAHIHAPRNFTGDERPMFTPIVSEIGEERAGMSSAKRMRPGGPAPNEERKRLIPPPRHWELGPIELLPTVPGRAAMLTDTVPITGARPDPADTLSLPQQSQTANKLKPTWSSLRMIRWFRPVYDLMQCTSHRVESALILDLFINPEGRAVEITVAQSSGSINLDKIALHAASLWRFAPPLWKSRPMEVWARVELQFNCS